MEEKGRNMFIKTRGNHSQIPRVQANLKAPQELKLSKSQDSICNILRRNETKDEDEEYKIEF